MNNNANGRTSPRYPLKGLRALTNFNFGQPRSRMQNPVVGGIEDYISQPIYDSVSFAAAAAFAQQTMFQAPRGQAGKTLAQTNMTIAGSLPNPQRLILRALRIFISNSTVPTDMFNLLQNVSVTLNIGTKPYFLGFLGLLSAGCGAMVTAAAQVGTAPAGSAPLFATSNGLPDQRSVFSLNQPITIEQGEPFQVILNPDVAFNFAAAGANPAGVGATIYAILDGDLYRAVS
ncbi:MAG: hypothetical protein LAP21_08435 [Acidobacteriia bacterium]|nr:hypothetical protein [Terriglobia bacterium]